MSAKMVMSGHMGPLEGHVRIETDWLLTQDPTTPLIQSYIRGSGHAAVLANTHRDELTPGVRSVDWTIFPEEN